MELPPDVPPDVEFEDEPDDEPPDEELEDEPPDELLPELAGVEFVVTSVIAGPPPPPLLAQAVTRNAAAHAINAMPRTFDMSVPFTRRPPLYTGSPTLQLYLTFSDEFTVV